MRIKVLVDRTSTFELSIFWIFLEFTTTVVSSVYTTWGYNKIPIILFHVRRIWAQHWASNRPNKTGTWLLIKCSFQNGPFSTKNMFFNLENAFTVVNWAVFKCRFDMKISKNTDNNIFHKRNIRITFKFNQHWI